MKNIRWGILSTGRIANKFAEALAFVKNSEIAAVGSRNIETAKSFAEQYKINKFYGSYEELVKDPNVDVIYVATPHNLHFENTIMALENGKHVLCEKPFGVNSSEAKKMIAKAKEKNLFLMEALWSRFLPNIIKVKELIDSGTIGKVNLLTAYFSFKSPHSNEHRHFNVDLCGGTLLDIGIYNVFISTFLLGQPKGFHAVAGLGETGVDKNLSLTFKYENELLAVMYSSFMADTPIVAEIHGEKGKIFLEACYFCPRDIRITYNDGKEEIIKFDFISNGYNYEAEEVVKCIQEGKIQSDLMSWNDSIKLIEMMDAIRQDCGIFYPKHDKGILY